MPPLQDRPIYTAGALEVDLAERVLRVAGAPALVGARAFQILEILVQSAGELVARSDLILRVWPEGKIAENTLEAHISALRLALGAERGVLKTISGRGYRLLGSWTAVPPSGVGATPAVQIEPAPPASSSTNLPVATFALIGRAAATRRVLGLVSTSRAIMLTGPGGIGKTVLALEVARSLLGSFEGSVLLVELASLSDPALVAAAVARVLGLRPGSSEFTSYSVARAIGEGKIFLILDNCEHVIDAVAELASVILRTCPHSTILATSREALRIDGEHVVQVPPLEAPPQHQENMGAILGNSAVQLFIARAKLSQSGFAPDLPDLLAISAICRRLDGIPLAIELAAARAASLDPAEIAARLDDRFELLTGGQRTALPRHQTLRAAVDWSYDLLSDSERHLLCCLSVFPAGFSLDAAAAVAGGTGASALSVLEGIAALGAKSLVAMDGGSRARRWRLLETIRVYALQKLAAGADANGPARRHAEFFRDLLTQSLPGERNEPSANLSDRFLAEIDNIRAALDWAFLSSGDTAIGIVLTAACAPLWLHLSLLVECRERTQRALDRLGAEPRVDAHARFQLQISLGVALFLTTGSAKACGAMFDQALETAVSLADADSRLRALWGVFAYRINNGEPRAALPIAHRFLDLAKQSDNPTDALVGDRLVGIATHYGGDQAAARRCIERVLDFYVPPENQRHSLWFLYDQRVLARAMLARVLWLQGYLDQARRHAQASVDDALALGHKPSICYALGFAVCPIALRTGDLQGAERALAMLIDVATGNDAVFWTRLGPCLEGALLANRGDMVRAAKLLSSAHALSGGTGLAVHFSGFAGDLAEALAAIGRLDEGLSVITGAIAQLEGNGLLWCMPDLLRVRGQLLLQTTGGQSATAAVECFSRSIGMAREQSALFWELRSALSLARLRIGQGLQDDAQEILAHVYDRFGEGFDTADLVSAEAVLAGIGGAHRHSPPLWA